jgi:hypothetical protein
MDLYIVVLERGDKRATYAVHTHYADDAARMALARRTGWRIVDVTLENLPKAIHVAEEELEPAPEAWRSDNDERLLARCYALLWDGDFGILGLDLATDIHQTFKPLSHDSIIAMAESSPSMNRGGDSK